MYKKNAKLKYKTTTQSKNKFFWNSECSKAVALRRKARRKFEKHPSLINKINYNKQTALTKKEIKKTKETFLDKLHKFSFSSYIRFHGLENFS